MGAVSIILILTPIVHWVIFSNDWRIAAYSVAVPVVCVGLIREPYDLKKGQSLLKAISDNLSWVIGGIAGYGLTISIYG